MGGQRQRCRQGRRLPLVLSPAWASRRFVLVVLLCCGLGPLQSLALASSPVQEETASPVEMTAAAESIGPERMRAMVEDYLHSQRQRLPREAEIRFTPERLPQACALPPGEVVWEVLPASPTVFNSSSFSLIARINGRAVCNLVVRGRVEAMAPVAVAVRTLQRGEAVGAGDIRLSRQDLLRQRQPFLQAADLIGRLATRTLAAGVVIEARDVAAPPVVKKGEVVKLITGSDSFQLSTMALATADGADDAVILVRNLNSNKVIHARVSGPGLVTVEH
ncbi:MAG: flagella basal body P-ring formation protein FlgA [Desulfobulbaceae bacterium A2]|nr:MAG: flagella basal body P-ring formation protein FlgA [Desulfobulbaceae bacterium A2]